jgi:hypothetical protein
LPDFNHQVWNFSIDFHEVLYIEFHVNLSSGSRVDICGKTKRQMDTRGGNKRHFRDYENTLVTEKIFVTKTEGI